MKSGTTKRRFARYLDGISEEAKRTYISCSLHILAILLISLCVNACIRIDVIYYGSTIGEASVTEIVQVVLLIITTLMFLRLANKFPHIRHATILIAGFFSVLTIRELDHWLDTVFHGFWLFPALMVTTVALAYASRGGVETLNQLAVLLRIHAVKQMIAWVVLLLVFSRIYGMGAFWQDVMNEYYVREVKNIVEEGIELLCYSLICLSGIQAFRQVRTKAELS